MAIEPIKGFYVHDEVTDTDGVAKVSIEAVQEFEDDIRDETSNWLDEHPEASTTVLPDSLTTDKYKDGSITSAKIDTTFLEEIKNAYITPEMFGAKGDGTTDDTVAIQDAINHAISNNKQLCFISQYAVKKQSSEIAIFSCKALPLIGFNNAEIIVKSCDSSTDLFRFTGTSKNHNLEIAGIKFNVAGGAESVRYVMNFVFEKDADILYNMSIHDCIFTLNASYKIYTNGWTNGGFNNCKFNNNIVYGLFLKSLSFGDSNKINGNSLYGSESITLSDYVINLIQTQGSAGCEVCKNNCTSGLGYFENFRNIYFCSNQIENTTQSTLDYLVKLVHGSNATLECCNMNAHGNCGLVYATGANCIMRNCNYFGVKSESYAVDNANAHITIIESPRYFDGTNVKLMLDGGVVNGYATETLYDDERATFYIDNALNLHYLPKVTATVNIAPLQCDVNTTNAVYFPVEKVGDNMVYLRITYKYQLYVDTLFDIPASIPIIKY